MTQEEKELLLKDLCARLPFGICANLPNHHLVSHKYVIYDINIQNGWTNGLLNCASRIQIYGAKVEDIKPYLRPMSSMTEEELEELNEKYGSIAYFFIQEQPYYHGLQAQHEDIGSIEISEFSEIYDWLNAHHFDYRGLIKKGLAIEAPEGMY